ncbi:MULTISPECIES: glycine cleavage system aminomethyltransferase GcvT [Candidatus Ichthyocystis]|uniref:Aminomethyltransferase n=1 Tax=Candidatus Ichthyocystis hellenicum TaxID=1561003 RepID=A0A0S4M0T7_9BURK|nr:MULTISPECIES: glycine cleavage system aminomethyltransferase GcvT [Ichthyocystis]CUT16875.1 glycine cleavage system aminomethyltransferase T [Candidatus Ichthyocystis hellenicum]
MDKTALKRTILFSSHQAINARFAPFSGWDMPLNYGSQIEEHHAVRNRVGIFDVSHMCCIDVKGRDAEIFTRHVFSNDISTINGYGKAMYGCLLNDSGGIIDDLIVYKLSPNWMRMVVNAAGRKTDIEWLTKQKECSGYEFELIPADDLAILSLQGPESLSIIPRMRNKFLRDNGSSLAPFSCALDEDEQLFIARTGYTGEDGFEIIVPNHLAVSLWDELLSQGASPCGLGARDTLRMESGLNLYGNEMDTTITPGECGIGWTVNLKDQKRNFVGKDALEKHKPRFKRLGVVLLSPGVLRQGQEFAVKNGANSKGDGILTSGGFSPTINRGIGIARVSKNLKPDQLAEIVIRNKPVEAKLCSLPFVRQGKILVAV